MKTLFEFLLPPVVDNTIQGMRFPVYVFMLVAIVSTVRSSIHLLAPDGGAGSIAGMDLPVAGARGIIFAFALWGSAQLVGHMKAATFSHTPPGAYANYATLPVAAPMLILSFATRHRI